MFWILELFGVQFLYPCVFWHIFTVPTINLTNIFTVVLRDCVCLFVCLSVRLSPPKLLEPIKKWVLIRNQGTHLKKILTNLS